MQSGPGLFSGVLIIAVSMGGLLALAFAAAYGRIALISPARTAVWLALAAFVVVALVPFLKYPAAPPGVGDPETINERTIVYVTMIVISLLAALAGVRLRAALGGAGGGSRATIAGLGLYAAVVLVAGIAMPVVDEVPAGFPATTLWDFRVASLGMHAVMWAGMGAVFSLTAARVMNGKTIIPRRRSGLEVKAT